MKNKCLHYKIMISRYVDNDLDILDRQTVENHIMSCSECHEIFDSYNAIKKLIAESYSPILTEECQTVLNRTCNAAFSPSANWSLTMKWATAVLLAALLSAGIGFQFFFKRTHSLPLVLEKESQSIFNTPLSTLIYYENSNGNTIHSQYVNLHDEIVSLYAGLGDDLINTIYQSPLFYDDSYVRQKYEAIVKNTFNE